MNSCKDCTERYIGCHGKCETYKAYCAERAELKAKIARSNQYDNYAKDIHATRRDRTAKHRRSTAGLSRFGG